MKKRYVIVFFILLTITTFIGCQKDSYKVSIETDRNSYDISSSSIQGIRFSAKLDPNKKDLDVKYYWSTTSGIFIESNSKDTVNSGESLLWGAISNKDELPSSKATITVTVKENKTGNILATSSINILKDGSYFKVVK